MEYVGQNYEPRPVAARGPLPSNIVCNKCLENLPRDLMLDSSSAEDGELIYCLECAAEESSTLRLTTDSLSLQDRVCRDISIPKALTDVGVADVPGDDDGEEMDIDTSAVPGPERSSKVDSVVNNLLQLEQMEHRDSAPIKR